MSDDTRPFPIQGNWDMESQPDRTVKSSTIPWWLAEEAYTYYSKHYGTRQSLERLAERGGFGRAELLGYLRKTL